LEGIDFESENYLDEFFGPVFALYKVPSS